MSCIELYYLIGRLNKDINNKKKALGFICKSLDIASISTKEVAYKTLVRPKLKYAAPVWHPYSITQINKVEKVQRTAAL